MAQLVTSHSNGDTETFYIYNTDNGLEHRFEIGGDDGVTFTNSSPYSAKHVGEEAIKFMDALVQAFVGKFADIASPTVLKHAMIKAKNFLEKGE